LAVGECADHAGEKVDWDWIDGEIAPLSLFARPAIGGLS